MPSSTTGLLESPIVGLLAGPTSRLPYQANVLLRSYLLEGPAGNILIYNSPGISAAAADIQSHGGAERLLINHAHEAMYGNPDLAVPVYVHERDRAETAQGMTITGTFTDRQMIDDDLEIIPTPGHTAGTTSYLWNNGNHRYLFTGDFIWIENGEWEAVVLDSHRRDEHLQSLELVRDLDFDVLVPWGVTDDGPSFALTNKTDIRTRVDAIIERVRNGGNR